ncbi:MAG: hypothetical protein OHK0029_42440 [Armatimonadaceae bacterium]
MLRTKHTTEQIQVFREGLQTPLIVQNALRNKRPYIHPILAPDGAGVLTEDAPPHHPWQHGLYVGLNDVNGVGFWSEGEKDGTFHPEPLAAPVVDGNRAYWKVETAWRGAEGKRLLTEIQEWLFADFGDSYLLDLRWTLYADTDVRFGEYPYGGLFLRMPYRKDFGGEAVNSAGQKNNDAEAQRARWVSVSMPIEDRNDPAGIAILDHPSNPEFPIPWRVDGQLGVAPSRSIAGAWELPQGELTVSLYELLVFTGATDPARIEAEWEVFSQSPTWKNWEGKSA